MASVAPMKPVTLKLPPVTPPFVYIDICVCVHRWMATRPDSVIKENLPAHQFYTLHCLVSATPCNVMPDCVAKSYRACKTLQALHVEKASSKCISERGVGERAGRLWVSDSVSEWMADWVEAERYLTVLWTLVSFSVPAIPHPLSTLVFLKAAATSCTVVPCNFNPVVQQRQRRKSLLLSSRGERPWFIRMES